MITEIRAPKTGLTAETLTITKWHKREGNAVKKDELLLTIETEKTSLDITAIRSGFVVRIIAPEGETVPVSQVIGLLADSVNEQIKDTAGGQSRTTFVDQDIAESVNGLPQDTGQKSTKVSPVARTMVKEYGIDLEAIRGTGPNGRIQKLDVEKYIKQKEESGEKVKAIKKGPETRPVKKTIKISPVRRTIAQITLKSKTRYAGQKKGI